MHTYLDCIPCFMIQALRAGRLVGLTDEKIYNMLIDLGKKIKNIKMDDPPPKTATMIYELINSYIGEKDPFETLKKQSTHKVLSLYPQLKKEILQSEDPLGRALCLAVTGNVIDFGISSSYDLESEIQKIMEQPFGRWDEEDFKKKVKQADWILYLGDNTGETVFDRLLIETLDRPVTYVVRESPIINDATIEDAIAAGLDKVATVISSGCSAPGTIWEQCTPEFQELFKKAPVIISKGQGNYETLSESDRPIFFLLKAKCDVIARHLGVEKGDLVLALENK